MKTKPAGEKNNPVAKWAHELCIEQLMSQQLSVLQAASHSASAFSTEIPEEIWSFLGKKHNEQAPGAVVLIA